MSAVDNNSALQSVLSEYSMDRRQKDEAGAANSDLGRDEFLKLLVAQLENQDPTSPQENGEFIAQLAQFSQLQESQKMTGALEEFTSSFQSTQHLQATSLIGRPVHVEAEETYLPEEGPVSVVADLESASSAVTLSVFNEAGEKVDSYNLGEQPSGRNEFIWSGMDADEKRFPSGMYRFEVQASQDGESVKVPTWLSANVNSVSIGADNALTLNVAGQGPVPMEEVIQIN
ncbi:MAG: flagellar hook assembly protein FlgD [Pseudomonadota bacterium]